MNPIPKTGFSPHIIHADGNTSIASLDLKKIRSLVHQHGVVIFRGFKEEKDFECVANQMGTILSWPTGNVFDLKYDASTSLSSKSKEALPFHYDGMFKRTSDSSRLGDVPLFQLFHCIEIEKQDEKSMSGRTLFTDTRTILASLSESDIEIMKKLQLAISTSRNIMYGSDSLIHVSDLISRHPVTQEDILRFHEPWGKDKTQLQTVSVEVVDQDQECSKWLCEKLTPMLYDQRYCYAHEWEQGDYLIADNYALLHCRTAIEKERRWIQRIHVN